MYSAEMTKPEPAVRSVAAPMPVSCCPPFSAIELPRGVLRSWLGNRYVLTIVGLAIAGSGLTLGWSWLTAIGVEMPGLVIPGIGTCSTPVRSPLCRSSCST